MAKKIKFYHSVEDVINIIKNKIKKLEIEKNKNYKEESYYIDIDSKIIILNDILNEIE